MPTIAEKLCQDLVDPVFKPSNYNNVKFKQSKKNVKSSSNFNNKPTKSVYVEKKRTVGKITPSERRPSARILKSKETIICKNYVDTGVNTLISGPLRCDNYCVTMVQKRDQNPCKCGKQRIKPKASSKIIQTLFKNSFIHMDKACAHSVDKVNCGTQFFKDQNKTKNQSILKTSKTSSKSKSNINFLMPNDPIEHEPILNPLQQEHIFHKRKCRETSYSNIPTHCLRGKQWALSNYPRRGPDF